MKSFLYFSLLFLAMGCGRELSLEKPDIIPTEPQENESIDLVEEEKSHFDTVTTLEVNPENFIDSVTHPYFSIVPGRKFYFDGASSQGETIHKELIASDYTQEIEGVTTYALWEREWKNNILLRDTKKWYAQDKFGNVWLFGEDELDLFGGFMKSPMITWKAGVGDAKAIIVMPANVEVSANNNNDNANREKNVEILSNGEVVKVPHGQLNDCIKIRKQKADKEEYQYYCREVGNLALELLQQSVSKIGLTKIEDNYSVVGFNKSYPKLEIFISEEKAKEIALEKVAEGLLVSAISLVFWDDKPAYEVVVLKKKDKKTIVYIDVQNGMVLKTID